MEKSAEFAYILGVLFGDGSCYLAQRKGCYKRRDGTSLHWKSFVGVIELAAKDRLFVVNFAQKCASFLGKKKYSIHQRKDGLWRVRLYSKKFAEWFQSLQMNELPTILKGIEEHFIGGFFDSDGTYHKQKLSKGRRTPVEWIIFSQKNKKLLEICEQLLRNANILYNNCYYSQTNKGVWQLRFVNKISVKNFAEKVPISIPRKIPT